VIRIIRFLTELGLNILFVVYYKLGFLGVLYANVLAAFFNVLVLLPFQWSYLKGHWNTEAFRSLISFAVPMLPNGIAYLIVEVSDKFLMLKLLDKETLGLYSANYKFGSILLFLVIAFRTAWQPFFLKLAEQKDAKEIYSRVMTYFVLMAVVIVVYVSFLIEYLVKIPLPGSITLLGKAYWPGIKIIPLILTSYLLYGIYVNLTVGIYIRKKAQLMIIFTGLAALVNIGSNFYLMPNFGIMGAATATLLSYLVMAITIFIANQKIYSVAYDYKRLVFLFVILLVSLFVYYYFQPQLLVRIIFLLLLPPLLLLSGFFRRAETDTVKRIFLR
jgi:O-antigen/teichoic acid export membrane protein